MAGDVAPAGFSSAAELFAALEGPDAVARRAVLGWVATHPAEAIALGPHEGRDLLELLLSLIDTDLDYPYWEDLAITIGVFDSPRATGFFLDTLASADRAEQAFDAASALGRRRGDGELDPRVAEVLMSDGPPERLAAAARFLGESESPQLSVPARIRMAALDDDRDAPPLDESTEQAWLTELGGPLGLETADRIAEHAEAAAALLGSRLDSLQEELREWLLAWVAADRVPRKALLEALGPGAVEALRPLAVDGAPEARGGAVAALLDLGDDEWLRRELLSEPGGSS